MSSTTTRLRDDLDGTHPRDGRFWPSDPADPYFPENPAVTRGNRRWYVLGVPISRSPGPLHEEVISPAEPVFGCCEVAILTFEEVAAALCMLGFVNANSQASDGIGLGRC